MNKHLLCNLWIGMCLLGLISMASAQEIRSEFKIDSIVAVKGLIEENGLKPLFDEEQPRATAPAAFEVVPGPEMGFTLRKEDKFFHFSHEGKLLWQHTWKLRYHASQRPELDMWTDESSVWILETKNKPTLFNEIILTRLNESGVMKSTTLSMEGRSGMYSKFMTKEAVHLVVGKQAGVSKKKYEMLTLDKKTLSMSAKPLELVRENEQKSGGMAAISLFDWKEIAIKEGSVLLGKCQRNPESGDWNLSTVEIDGDGIKGTIQDYALKNDQDNGESKNVPTLFMDSKRNELHAVGITYETANKRNTTGLYWYKYDPGTGKSLLRKEVKFANLSSELSNGNGDAGKVTTLLGQIIPFRGFELELRPFERETGALHLLLVKDASSFRKANHTGAYEIRMNLEGEITGVFDLDFPRWPNLYSGYWIHPDSDQSLWTTRKTALTTNAADPLTWLRFRKAKEKGKLWRVMERNKDAIILGFDPKSGSVNGIHLIK